MSGGAVVGERTLWSGTTRFRVCSASRRPSITVSEWMRQAVDEVYRQWLALPAEWTPEQRNRFIDLETDRLDRKAFDLAMDLRQAAIHRWTAEHGQHPDHDTTIRLHQTAEQNAREAIVRTELYDKIPPRSEGAENEPPEPVSGVPWEKRWMDRRFRAEPTDQVKDLASRVWPSPQHTPMFRVLAAYLLATRLQDGLDLPTSPRHVLAVKLVADINEKLAEIGYPPE